MAFAVARTRDEAYLYLELHPCPDCATAEAAWEHALIEVDGELTISYSAVCPGCAASREYLFALPAHETPAASWPTFGGAEPSELLDAGQWMVVADHAASNVPADPVEARVALSIAWAAVGEVVKFVPPGRDVVPAGEFWTPQGRRVFDTEPGRFRLDRLLLVQDTYAELVRETGAN